MSRYSKRNATHNATQPAALPARTEAVEFAYVSLQRTQRGLVGMLIACAILGLTVFRASADIIGNRAFWPIILATSLLTFAFTIRNSMVIPALNDLRRNPRDAAALKRWSRNSLIVFSLCAAVGLTGFAMQLLGAAVPISITMYAIAVAYLFLLRPIKP